MNLILLNRPRTPRGAVTRSALLHPECPIEQALRSADSDIQRRLVQPSVQRTAAAADAFFVASDDGLRVLGRNERALERIAEELQARFENRLTVHGPMVRYAFGVPVLEPYMKVRVQASLRSLQLVRDDMARRRGWIERVDELDPFVLEAEAPLATLLGYEGWLKRALGADQGGYDVTLRLSRYLPIDDDGPRAA
jgi:hypothetical protein